MEIKNAVSLNKKGVFFTALVIVILSLFLVSYTVLSGAQERKVVQKRIETMNSFLFSIEEDLSRQLFISGFRIIFLFDKRIIETRTYLTDINASFEEAFFNGTINGYTDQQIQELMTDATFNNITAAINAKASRINVNVSLSLPELEVIQEDPWSIKITLISNLSMQDLSGLASWNRTQTVTVFIPVTGFEDPTYFLNSGVSNIINRTPYTEVNAANFATHAANTYYTNYSGAPSFLDRLTGSLSLNSSNGIESIATPKLPAVANRPSVDYLYFPNTTGACEVSGVSGVWLDPEHITLYGLACV